MSENEKKGKSSLLLIILILLLAAVNAYLFMLYSGSDQEVQAKTEEIAVKDEKIKISADSISFLTAEIQKKIEEVDKLGGDTASLGAALRKALVDLKTARGARYSDLKKIKDLSERIEDYITELSAKEAEIAQLKQERESIFQESTSLKSNLAKRDDSLSKLAEVKKELDSKVKMAAVLRAEALGVTIIERNGKERKEDRYRSNRIDKLKVTFRFADNKVAEIETKEIMLRIVEPDGATLSDATLGGGSLTSVSDGQEVPFTARQSHLFDNSGNPISFVWNKGSAWKSGTHIVEIWCEGYKVGSTTFVVR